MTNNLDLATKGNKMAAFNVVVARNFHQTGTAGQYSLRSLVTAEDLLASKRGK